MTKPPSQPRELYTAMQVAQFCAVDLKTIHNWALRGDLRHFRTPGRHIRLKRADVVEFLEKFGYPVPAVLLAGKTRAYVIDDDGSSLGGVQRALSKTHELTTFADPIDALITLGAKPPDCVLIDMSMKRCDALACLSRLKRMPATRKLPAVAYGTREALRATALDAGASAFLVKVDADSVRDALDALLGGGAT